MNVFSLFGPALGREASALDAALLERSRRRRLARRSRAVKEHNRVRRSI